MRILAIESSCDESAAAILDSSAGACSRTSFSARSSCIGSTAGSCRSSPRAITSAGCCRWSGACWRGRQTGRRALDGVAYTAGPGLIGALLTGAALARRLAYAWGIPAIGVHHLEGHLLAPLLEATSPAFPARRSARLRRPHDADRGAGRRSATDCWDRRATMRPERRSTRPQSCWVCPIRAVRSLRALADQGRRASLRFPRPMLDRPGLEFSFSGLKTAVLHAVRNRPLSDKLQRGRRLRGAGCDRRDPDREGCARARATGLDTLVVSGGVGANRALRAAPRRTRAERKGSRVYYPRIEFCTDNAAMIAVAGLARLAAGQHDTLGHSGARAVAASIPESPL